MSNNKEIPTFSLENCIADEKSNCIECELGGELICFVNKSFANKFTLGNILYRIFALIILIFSGLLIGQWWMLISYGIVLLLTFTIIEPRLLCSHCPFYEKEGRFLKCWALRGMPKLWQYRPGPISRTERYLMLIFGSFIDLFPFVGVIWGIIYYAFNPTNNLVLGIGIIISSSLFIILAIYFGKIIMGSCCTRCTNFSCAMNKVPKKIINKFLEKNQQIKEAWINAGWSME